MKLASFVTLLAVCRKLQTDPEWLVQAPRLCLAKHVILRMFAKRRCPLDEM